MKINHLNSANINPYKRSIEKQADAAAQPAKKQDQVQISNKAKELQEQNGIVQSRQEKVAAIKQQVESGTYTIDPKAIAQSLINHYQK
ncbi:flagellar biosynthesis anti-sigma factor FlgM [Metabacillus idriensis]|uniref:flagellar biosynthesis anti-sigma factor FlgM n=1 Tax=Metabacillus idriensis TaxID=324768 RepID=UPI00163B4D4F|nr:flagellar biosynthesis anti-sigma factor FlgM [Metabacillus idriensis]QNG60251.1 flagellar biosynthesis anti-sigma factor FlgM [Bacillus sp. PAMC26568]